ncbi:MAG: TIGR02757 family protein [Deltaproteobacteria bacterium]|nr:TIGR02757 family protein [Deltaproteobacteria bacterium]
MGNQPSSSEKNFLEDTYRAHHQALFVEQDPIRFVHNYRNPADQEPVAFLTALLAYGNVKTIFSSVSKILSVLGPNPRTSLIDQSFAKKFNGFKHRFTTGEDIEIVCFWLSCVLRRFSSIEQFFIACSDGGSQVPMKTALSGFVHQFTHLEIPNHLSMAAQERKRSLKYLIPDPCRGSACKRLNLFLRWMVRRRDGIDLGLWRSIRPSQLILPLDTHLLKTLNFLGWARTNNATWKVAEQATDRLRAYDASDPIKYDFALCHLSMLKSARRHPTGTSTILD